MARNSENAALETRNKLFETSLKHFTEKGYENSTIDDICKEINLTKGAFYTHFNSKDDILIHVWIRADEWAVEQLNSHDYKTNKEKFLAYARIIFTHTETFPKELMSTIYATLICRKQETYMVSSNRPLYKVFQEIIMAGQEKKEFQQDLTAEIIAHMTVILIRGIILDWLFHEKYAFVEDGMKLVNQFFKSLIMAQEK
jgi:AcrR family transcriptional regulator